MREGRRSGVKAAHARRAKPGVQVSTLRLWAFSRRWAGLIDRVVGHAVQSVFIVPTVFASATI